MVYGKVLHTYLCHYPCYWCPDDGLMIITNVQNLEHIQHDKLEAWWNKHFHTNAQNRLTYHFLLPWHYHLDVCNARWVQTSGLTSLFNDVNKSNLTLCTVLNWWNLIVASTLQHRQMSNLIVWNCQLKTVLVENLVYKTILRINKHTWKLNLKFLGNLWQ